MKKRIVLIDDDLDILEGLKDLLEGEGYEVHCASDGDEGMENIRDYSPQLVITDIIMPEKDGITLLFDVRRELPGVKTLVISGGGRISAEKHLEVARKIGVDKVLAKPFSSAAFLDAVDELLK